MDFKDRVAVITGAASGIGKACAQEFARLGAHVAVVDINEQGANEVAEAVGGVAIPCDVGDEASVNAMVAEAERQLGPIDLLFNNAAVVAEHLSRTTESRVAVLDVDYHHGNGTQQIFYDREEVFFASLHGDPRRAYPYLTGHVDETGSGAGSDATVNYPLPAGCDDDAYLTALTGACERVAASGAETVVVSLGLDTFHEDPISDLSAPEAYDDAIRSSLDQG